MDNNKTIYNVIKKTIEDYGQPIEVSKHTDSDIQYTRKALVKYKKQAVQTNSMFIELQDQYEFIMLDKIEYNKYIYWNNAFYKVVSIDNTTPNVYKVYCEFNNLIEKHIYTLKIENKNPINIKVGEIIKLDCTCTKDGEIDEKPTLTYSNDNINIATIENGEIKAITEGFTIINVFYNGVKDAVNVNVKKADEYSIDCNDIELDVNSTVQLNPICKKNGIEVKDTTCNYTVLDSSIVTIGENGLINGIKEGSTAINISWEGITKTINVKVNQVSIIYTIEGVDRFKQKTNATFTINPLVDCTFGFDKIDTECNTATIASQSNGSCVVRGNPLYASSPFTLRAYIDGKEIANKEITVTKN